MQHIQGVQYESVNPSYLEQRQLRKSAGLLLLWALGVGAVISGNFFGWNFSLATGGIGGLAFATILMAILYICMVYCIAELSTAMPHAGGFYSFARSAFGPWGGFIIGVTDTIEYVLTPAVIVVGIGSYLNTLYPMVPEYIWWIGAYTLSISLNILGTRLTLWVGLGLTLLSIGVLISFYSGALLSGAFQWELAFNVPPLPGQTDLLPAGWYGVFISIPYAIWFFLAIEQLPLAAEEARDVRRDMPRSLFFGMGTLLVLAFCTLLLNSGVGGGALAIGASSAPLIDGFSSFIAGSMPTLVITLIALSGLAASFHTIIYAYGRVIFSMSRAGYYPRWMSITGTRTNTPHFALMVGGGIGLVAAWLIDTFGSSGVGATLLNMAVFGAVLSYIGVMASYIKIKRDRPDMERPYTSPLGVSGAAVGIVLAVLALVATIAAPEYRPGVIGVIITLGLAILYFATYSSRHLVAQAPEEHNALTLERRIAELQVALDKARVARLHVEQIMTARANAVRAVIHDLNHSAQAVQAALDLWVMDMEAANVETPMLERGHLRLQAALDQQKICCLRCAMRLCSKVMHWCCIHLPPIWARWCSKLCSR
ncbi:MAG: amino acid permease [Chloroflexaceae bacterium]|nr:amino acid permease [Chloroflexaceae bacterium]